MNQRITKIIILPIIVLIAFACQPFDNYGRTSNPAFVMHYLESGYYTFDPETILESIDQSNTNVFTPFYGHPDEIEHEYAIAWTQSDFFIIANELSLIIWNEPLDLEGWDVYRVSFRKGCMDASDGFNDFSITYYKLTKGGWEREYFARIIEVQSWLGLVAWGVDNDFTASVFDWWHRIDLTNFNITADDALKIAEKHGGEGARMKVDNKCSISVRSLQRDNGMWNVDFFLTDFNIDINPHSGTYKILRSGP